MMEDGLRQVKGQGTNDNDDVETRISQGNAAKILLSTACFFRNARRHSSTPTTFLSCGFSLVFLQCTLPLISIFFELQ